MRPIFSFAGASLLVANIILAPSLRASAAVTESEFPPNSVRELIAICAPDKDDPAMTAAVNFCQGFVEGAVVVEEANEARKGARKLLCLPSPRPPRGTELANFITWANQLPGRLDMPSIDGVFIYLAEKFPCTTETTGQRRKR